MMKIAIKRVLFFVLTISLVTSCAFSFNVNVNDSILEGKWVSNTIYDPNDPYSTQQAYNDETYIFDNLGNFQYYYKSRLSFSGTYTYNDLNGIMVLTDGRDTEFVQVVNVDNSTLILDYSDQYGALYVEFYKRY